MRYSSGTIRRARLTAVALCVLFVPLLSASTAWAGPIRITFSGRVTRTGVDAAPIVVGDAFLLSVLADVDSAVVSPGAGFGQPEFSDLFLEPVVARVGASEFALGDPRIDVFPADLLLRPRPVDLSEPGLVVLSGQIGDDPLFIFSLRFENRTGRVPESTELLLFPELADFDATFSLSQLELLDTGDLVVDERFAGTIDRIVRVPEPALPGLVATAIALATVLWSVSPLRSMRLAGAGPPCKRRTCGCIHAWKTPSVRSIARALAAARVLRRRTWIRALRPGSYRSWR